MSHVFLSFVGGFWCASGAGGGGGCFCFVLFFEVPSPLITLHPEGAMLPMGVWGVCLAVYAPDTVYRCKSWGRLQELVQEPELEESLAASGQLATQEKSPFT